MPPLGTLEGFEVVWRPHWPVHTCAESPTGVHEMVRLGEIGQCSLCLQWLAMADYSQVVGSTDYAVGLIKEHQN